MSTLSVTVENYYQVEHWRQENLLWRATSVPNLVTTAGKNKLLDATLKTGLLTPAWFLGLVSNTGFTGYVVADTAGAHAGWTESTAYSEAVRQTWSPGGISAGSVSGATASFSTNATTVIRGAFMIDSSTKGGSTGTLYGEVDFGASVSVINGDLILLTVTCTAS